MKQYKLILSGYGKNIAIGTVDKDVHFFWKMNNPDVTKKQLFREAYISENNNTHIEDSGSPFYIPIWKDNCNILLEAGLYPDDIHVLVYDQYDSLIWYSDQIPYTVSQKFDQNTDLGPGYYLKTWRERKGEYGVSLFQDKMFDPGSLNFQAISINDQKIINVFQYQNQNLDITESEFGGTSVNYDFFRVK
jgi:hypothetical protein